jgi:hypothetical protein
VPLSKVTYSTTRSLLAVSADTDLTSKSKVMCVSTSNCFSLKICEIVRHYAPVRTASAKIGDKSAFTPVFDRYPPSETFSSFVQPSNSVHR